MQQDRLAFIDTLRAVAAMAVLTFHLPIVADGGPLAAPGWLDHALLVLGSSGVDLFFCVSGFVLCLMAPRYEANRRPVVSFYIKRALRIAPLFFVVLGAWVVMFVLRHRPIDWWQIAAEVMFVFNLDPRTANGFAFADWTIGVEMLFYAVFPLLYRLVPGPGRKLVALLLAFPLFELVMLGYQQLPIEPELLQRFRWLSVFNHAPTFLLGMLAHDLYRRLTPTRYARALGIAALLGTLLLFADALGERLLLGRFGVTLGWAMLLLSASLVPWFFVNRATAFVGRISYSIYLWHGPVVMAMGGVFAAIFTLGMPDAVSLALCVAAALLVVLPASWLSFIFIETPGNRLATRLVRWLDRSTAVETAGQVDVVSRSRRP